MAQPFPKLLYAHRGASLRLPENTLEAFRSGLQASANALELDVRRTKDDVIIVFHDEDGVRVANQDLLVAESNYETIRRWRLSKEESSMMVDRQFGMQPLHVPTLSDVLEAFSKVPLNVDIKAHDLRTVSLVIDVVTKHKAEDRVRLTSSSHRVISMLHSLRYKGPIGTSQLEVAALYFLPLSVLRRSDWQNRAVQIPLNRFGIPLNLKSFIDKCHALDMRVDYWVINSVGEARALLEMGADGLMSDDPGLLATLFPG